MITLDAWSSSSVKVLFPLVAGIGLGLLLHAPYQVFTRALQSGDMAIGTSAFFLMRFTGATIGLVSAFFFSELEVPFSQFNTQSLAGTVFNIRLDKTLPSEYGGDSSTIDLATVQLMTPPELRDEVLEAIARSIQVRLWVTKLPLSAFSRYGHLDYLDVVLSVPWGGGSRKSLASYVDDVGAYFEALCSLRY